MRAPRVFLGIGCTLCLGAATACGGDAVRSADPVLTLVPASLDFGTLRPGESRTLPLTLRNTGSAPLEIFGVRVLDDPRGAFSARVAPGRLLPAQTTTGTATYVAADGPTADAARAEADCSAANGCGSGVRLLGRTERAVCETGTHTSPEGTGCESDVRACRVDDGTGSQSWSGAWGECLVVACNSGFHVEGSACVSDLRACTVADGTGSQEWSGAWGECIVAACNAEFHAEANACVADSRACEIADGFGTQSWSGAWGECVLASCDAGFHAEGNACVADSRACEIGNGSGTQAWSGTWGECVLAACNAGFHAEASACVADSRACDIPGGAGTQGWSGAWGSCVLVACCSGYHAEQGACAADRAPEITRQPAGVAASEGQDAAFSVEATGSPPPTYRWRFNGQSVSGATDATFTVHGVRLADAGNYDVEASNPFGSVRSDTAVLTVPVVLTADQGSGPCWLGAACYGGFGDPPACPAGYSDEGVQTACGNPNYPGGDPVLELFFRVNPWGCPPGYVLGVSVRTCQPQ